MQEIVLTTSFPVVGLARSHYRHSPELTWLTVTFRAVFPPRFPCGTEQATTSNSSLSGLLLSMLFVTCGLSQMKRSNLDISIYSEDYRHICTHIHAHGCMHANYVHYFWQMPHTCNKYFQYLKLIINFKKPFKILKVSM